MKNCVSTYLREEPKLLKREGDAAGVTAALVCAGVGFLAEFLLAAWAYRKPGFRSLRVRLG